METGKQPSTKLILSGLLLGLLVSSLNQTITVTAMTTTVQELGGISLFGWALSIYMLMSTASMPIYGKLADLYSSRTGNGPAHVGFGNGYAERRKQATVGFFHFPFRVSTFHGQYDRS
ncbi:hypothetical protein [Brevibacillus nitrificans]|uniref:hypothetical protein n=1 Tax=Brevibacillus nitrificans TaxID=651560 RepID=UPI0028640467|nr:hypothetical protein [Brevibacillus nitrificans]MDR7314304.1 MFS family permease [Brevibacillus nitrificans]